MVSNKGTKTQPPTGPAIQEVGLRKYADRTSVKQTPWNHTKMAEIVHIILKPHSNICGSIR